MTGTTIDKFVRIKFDGAAVGPGFALVLHAGTVIYTGDPTEFTVPETTAQKLTEAGITFARLT